MIKNDDKSGEGEKNGANDFNLVKKGRVRRLGGRGG